MINFKAIRIHWIDANGHQSEVAQKMIDELFTEWKTEMIEAGFPEHQLTGENMIANFIAESYAWVEEIHEVV